MESKKLRNDLVSIIIPTFNRSSLISDTILSVINQTYINWELIIVDDGSEDCTEEVVKPFLIDERIKFYKRPQDRLKGGNAARNYGYELSSGEYMKWLDSDDLLEPNCLEMQVKAMISGKHDVVFCRSKFFHQNEETNEIVIGDYWHDSFPTQPNFLENFVIGKIRFCNNDGLWDRKILDAKPYYNKLRNSQEFLMIIKHLSRNAKVGVLDKVLVLVRQHEDQMVFKRNYATFSKHQCLARYMAIKELKLNKTGTKRTYTYLFKSITYYFLYPIKKGEFPSVLYNIKIWLKSFYLVYFK